MTTAAVLVVLVLAGASMMVWGLGSILVRGFSSRRVGIILLLGGVVLVVNVSLYVRDVYWERSSPDRTNVRAGAEESGRAFLHRPEATCRLLVDHGLTPEVQDESGSIWGKATPMYYSCQAARSVSANRRPTALIYRVQSDDGNRIDLIRLQVDVPDDRSETAVLEEFKRLASVLFERLPSPMPDGFVTAVDNRVYQQFDQDDATVELLRDRLERGYRLRMEIRPDPRKP